MKIVFEDKNKDAPVTFLQQVRIIFGMNDPIKTLATTPSRVLIFDLTTHQNVFANCSLASASLTD
jgi:hypothetical protein